MSPEQTEHPSPLDNKIRELAAAAKAHDQAFRAAAAPIDAGAIARAPTWSAGARVLDLVTGMKGVVVDGKRENVVLPGA